MRRVRLCAFTFIFLVLLHGLILIIKSILQNNFNFIENYNDERADGKYRGIYLPLVTNYLSKTDDFINSNVSERYNDIVTHINNVQNQEDRGDESLVHFIINKSFTNYEGKYANQFKHDWKIVNKLEMDDNTHSTKENTFKLMNDKIENPQENNHDEIEIFGDILNNKNYAVFSTTTDSRDSMTFIFYLPLTALAWRRVGFESLIVIVGSRIAWNSDPLLSFVMEQLIAMKAVLIFLSSRSHLNVLLSQISRIYAGNIILSRNNNTGNVYFITTDADIWPLKSHEYLLPINKTILSLNVDCCSPFKHRGKVYRMLPMSNIGMKIEHWYALTNSFSVSPSSVDEMLTQVVREFGSIALRPSHKGDNVGWYLDQMLVSIFITKWSDSHPSSVKYTSRNIELDRLDRNSWQVGHTIDDKLDAHLPGSAFRPEIWYKIVPLFTLMYGKHSKEFRFSNFYFKKFTEIIKESGIP